MFLSSSLLLIPCWMFLSSCCGDAIPLNMAADAVDDMYHGCGAKMKDILKELYPKELQFIGWKTSKSCADEKLQLRCSEDMDLTLDNMQAICMFTGFIDYPQINKDIREKAREYGGAFKYHNFHYFLTSAIQILNKHQGCQTTYRRTKNEFDGKVNDRIRLGSFSSSSLEKDQTRFGSETCFQIKTCLGAYLKNYSKYENEKEVLIPPYEVFMIKDKIEKPKTVEGLEDCRVVYILEHSGRQSNLNCQIYRRYQNRAAAGG